MLYFFQLKDQIEQLERRLASESKRTEELQASVEEATFCGDELTVRINIYFKFYRLRFCI